MPRHVNRGWLGAHFGVMVYVTALPLGNKTMGNFLAGCQLVEISNTFKSHGSEGETFIALIEGTSVRWRTFFFFFFSFFLLFWTGRREEGERGDFSIPSVLRQ